MSHYRVVLFFWSALLIAVLACGGANEQPTPTLASRGQEVTANPPTEIAEKVETVVPASSTPPPTITIEPTPTLQPTSPPTPTIDPNLADWTFLVYMAADNDLELQGLLDIDEMEAAGQSDKVNVLVQVDLLAGDSGMTDEWTETRRYFIEGDKQREEINPLLVESLGEQNMGDPNVLTDFIVWGVQNYPANHYALILWNHGSGWLGIAFDDSTPGFDELSMKDLGGALSRALPQTGIDKLDIIGFDACLMAQLDVLNTVRPYADIAIASEELEPGAGWDYEAFLSAVYNRSTIEPDALAAEIVESYVEYFVEVEPDEYVTLSAVDLEKVPALTQSLEQLGQLLSSDPVQFASAIGDARRSAEGYATFYSEEAEYYASIDLWHFASILAQRSPNEQASAAAQAVMEGVEQAVISEAHGTGFQFSKGIAIYFPRLSQFYDSAYSGESPLRRWDTFLSDYHSTGLAEIPDPEFNILDILDPLTGIQRPTYLDVEIIGQDIENVFLITGQYETDGDLRLMQYDTLIPEPTYLEDGTPLYEWRDGVHSDFFVWYTDLAYLSDGVNGDYVVMRATDYDSNLYSIEGRYRRANEPKYFDVNMVMNLETGETESIWGFQEGSSGAPYEVTVGEGDEFQIYNLYFDDSGFRREAGTSLFFTDDKSFYYSLLPAQSGEYSLGFRAETIAGQFTETYHDFTVDNDNLIDGYAAYLDPYLGFRFLYPNNWYRPIYDGTMLYTSNFDGTTYLYVTLYPDLESSASLADLKQQSLENFGEVDILYEEALVIGGEDGLLTAYGYEDSAGTLHTGLFLTFIHDNIGYVVDLDGPQSEEEANIEAMGWIRESWVFQPIGFGLLPGEYPTLNNQNSANLIADDFAYSEDENGWGIYTSPDSLSFLASRRDPNSGLGRLAVLEDWLEIAGEDVQGFTTGEPYRYPMDGVLWVRADFGYTNSDGVTLWGFIMVAIEDGDGEEIIVWVEAPSDVFTQLEEEVFPSLFPEL